MEPYTFPRSDELPSAQGSGIGVVVTAALAAWLLIVVSLGALGVFAGAPGRPPIALGAAFGVPLLVFYLWQKWSGAFRDFLLSIDLRLIASMQAWRWAGFGFVALYAHHVLPAGFALIAGPGDMAVGIVAPWMVLRLIRDRSFATSAAFVRWNLLGMLDLVVAISLGVAGAILAAGKPGVVSTAPMSMLPLLLIPGFMVPLFLMLHTTALMQSRQIRRLAPTV